MTIDTIAENLGVSTTTVSRAISGKGRLSEATRTRVRNYIEEIGYQPSAVARGLAQKKTFNIGIVWPGNYETVELPFFQNCLIGMSEVTKTKGYDLLVCPVTTEDISGLQRIVENGKVDGVVLTRSLLQDEPAAYLRKMGLPFVLIGSHQDQSIRQVDNDNFSACKELTERMIESGSKIIALIGGDKGHAVTQTRRQGYEAGMTAMGLEIDPSLIFMDFDEIDVDRMLQTILAKRVDTILCMDDKIAENILAACRKRKILIPDHLKLASFYDSQILSENDPSVTAVHFDDKKLGGAAAEALMNMIDKEDKELNKQPMGYEICFRTSTDK